MTEFNLKTKEPKPRILYLTPCWPNQMCYGAPLRSLQIARALREIGSLQVVVVGFDEERPDDSGCSHEFDVIRSMSLQHTSADDWRTRLRRALDPRFLNPSPYTISKADVDWMREHRARFDMVWFYKLRTANVFEQWVWPGSVMDIDDVPSLYLSAQLRNAAGWNLRTRTRFRILQDIRRENLLPDRFTVLSVCSESDRRYLHTSMPVHVVPNGFGTPCGEPMRQPAQPPRIGFIGMLHYGPNADGIQWFVAHCWPRLQQLIPSAELRMIGRGTDGPRGPSGPGIRALGYVEDPSEEMATWSVMVVPIHLGAGTRTKIAEGFSRKIPMVATSLGAYGYDVRDRVELRFADTADAFVDACAEVIRDPAGSAAMAERGWHRFLTEWTWDAIRPRVWAAAEDCLRRSTGTTCPREASRP